MSENFTTKGAIALDSIKDVPRNLTGPYIKIEIATHKDKHSKHQTLRASSVTLERECVVALPCGTNRRTSLGVQVTSAAETSVLLASRS